VCEKPRNIIRAKIKCLNFGRTAVENWKVSSLGNYAIMLEVLKAVAINMSLFSDVTPYSIIYVLHLLSSETLGPFYKATGPHSGEKLHSV